MLRPLDISQYRFLPGGAGRILFAILALLFAPGALAATGGLDLTGSVAGFIALAIFAAVPNHVVQTLLTPFRNPFGFFNGIQQV